MTAPAITGPQLQAGMLLKPSDLKKMVAEWLAAGYAVDLDLTTGAVKVRPTQAQSATDADLIQWGKK